MYSGQEMEAPLDPRFAFSFGESVVVQLICPTLGFLGTPWIQVPAPGSRFFTQIGSFRPRSQRFSFKSQWMDSFGKLIVLCTHSCQMTWTRIPPQPSQGLLLLKVLFPLVMVAFGWGDSGGYAGLGGDFH